MDRLGLGIDAGGTQTRWALANGAGEIVAEGHVAGLSATQMGDTRGRDAVRGIFSMLATQVLAIGQPRRVCAGLTGFDGLATLPAQWLAELLKISPQDVALRNDVEIAYLDSFAPGEGYLVYAGTGSIAAFIDADGTFHRAGGRGVTLDDGGGGFWIAREAMRHIWRRGGRGTGRVATVGHGARRVRAGRWQRLGLVAPVHLRPGPGRDRHAGAGRRCQRRRRSGGARHPRTGGRELARIGLALVRRYGPVRWR